MDRARVVYHYSLWHTMSVEPTQETADVLD